MSSTETVGLGDYLPHMRPGTPGYRDGVSITLQGALFNKVSMTFCGEAPAHSLSSFIVLKSSIAYVLLPFLDSWSTCLGLQPKL